MVNWKLLRETKDKIGEKRFGYKMVNMINEGKIPVEEFSLYGLWESLGRPTLRRQEPISSRIIKEDEFEIKEDMDSSAFPKITATLINKVVQEAYQLEYGVGMQLVRVLPSSLKEETLVGIAEDDELLEVPEGMPYQAGSLIEKYVKIKNRKWGRIVPLTEEMVKFDQTGQLIMRAKRVGEQAKSKQEEIIMNAVLGLVTTGEYASWRPQGSAATLYSATSNDGVSENTLDNEHSVTLADETDIDAAMVLFAAFVDEFGNPIHIDPKVLLTGIGLAATAAKIVKSGQYVGQGSTSTISVPAGSYSLYAGRFQPMSTAWIDQKKDSKHWYLGDFKKQFVYTQVFPLQVFQAKKGIEDEFKRDTIYQFKGRLMGGCGAITNRYVVQSAGA